MRKFTSIHQVHLEDLLEVLHGWETGQLRYLEVHDWAEAIEDHADVLEPRDRPEAALAEVIASLEMMYGLFTCKLDIPTMRHFLQLSQVDLDAAWRYVDAHWEGVNKDARLHAIRTSHRMRPDIFPEDFSWLDNPELVYLPTNEQRGFEDEDIG